MKLALHQKDPPSLCALPYVAWVNSIEWWTGWDSSKVSITSIIVEWFLTFFSWIYNSWVSSLQESKLEGVLLHKWLPLRYCLQDFPILKIWKKMIISYLDHVKAYSWHKALYDQPTRILSSTQLAFTNLGFGAFHSMNLNISRSDFIRIWRI